jgi:hypothetical protein
MSYLSKMQKFHIILVLCFISLFASAQTKPITKAAKTATVAPKTAPKTGVKPPKETTYTKWSLRAGCNLSVVYLARNIKDDNNAPGFCGGINYEINNFMRVSTLYTHFRPINIEPTWLNVRANTYEMNLEMIARFPNKKTQLYPFVGLSYNTYDGFFTGQLDYLNLKEYYAANTVVKNRWLGLNLGTGIEHNFGILGIFLDYRMRIGKQEDATGVNIMDVCYTAGLKVRIPETKATKKFAQRFGTKNRFNLKTKN